MTANLNNYSTITQFPDYSTLYTPPSQPVKKGKKRGVKRRILRENETICIGSSKNKKMRLPDEVENHVTEKVALLALRYIELWNTDNICFIGDTHSQGPSEHRKYHAVHSSCLPVIYVVNRTAYENWVKNGKIGPVPEKRILNARSSLDNHQNSTKGLNSLINRVDIMLEGGAANDKLRMEVLKIHNRVCQTALSLEDALIQSLDKYEEIIKEKITYLEQHQTTRNEKYKTICELFLKEVGNQKRLVSLRYFEGLLNIPPVPQNEDELPSDDERREICALKCSLVQRKAGLESKLHHDEFSPLKRIALGGKKRSPHNYTAGLKLNILENANHSTKARRCLQEQFNTSVDQLNATGDCKKADEYIKGKALNFNSIIQHAEKKYDMTEQLYNAYRLDLIKIFMKHKGYSLEKVLEEYRKVSNIENNEIDGIVNGTTFLTCENVAILSGIFKRNIRHFEMEAATAA